MATRAKNAKRVSSSIRTLWLSSARLSERTFQTMSLCFLRFLTPEAKTCGLLHLSVGEDMPSSSSRPFIKIIVIIIASSSMSLSSCHHGHHDYHDRSLPLLWWFCVQRPPPPRRPKSAILNPQITRPRELQKPIKSLNASEPKP